MGDHGAKPRLLLCCLLQSSRVITPTLRPRGRVGAFQAGCAPHGPYFPGPCLPVSPVPVQERGTTSFGIENRMSPAPEATFQLGGRQFGAEGGRDRSRCCEQRKAARFGSLRSEPLRAPRQLIPSARDDSPVLIRAEARKTAPVWHSYSQPWAISSEQVPVLSPPASSFSAASLTFIFLYCKSDILTALYLGKQLMSLPEMSHSNGSHLHQQNTWHSLNLSSPQAIFLSCFFSRLLKYWLYRHGKDRGDT